MPPFSSGIVRHKVEEAEQRRKSRYLGDEGKQRSAGGCGPLIDIRSVKMERHRGNSEAESRDHQDECGNRQARHSAAAGDLKCVRQSRKIGRSGQSIQVAETEQDQRRGEDAEQKVLHRRFLRRIVMPRQIKQHIGRDANKL
jgi:hypothetical protein